MILLQRILRSFTHLVYPPLCVHCYAELLADQPYLCSACLQLLELIDPLERCRYCFALNPCLTCQSKESTFTSLAAAFAYMGPAAALVKRFKYADQYYLSTGMAAFMTAQFLQLNWPLPDVIVPIPISGMRYLQRGYNQSALLAKGIGALLQVPVLNVLGRRSRGYSQAGLNRDQRKQLAREAFYLKNTAQLHDKTILLIDDVITTSTTLKRAAEALREGLPNEIFALAFCSAAL